MTKRKNNWSTENEAWDSVFHSKPKKKKKMRKRKGKRALENRANESRKEPEVQNNKYVVEGFITEPLPNGMFRVCLETQKKDVILGYISGKIRINNIKIIPGDRVEIVIEKTDITKGRITKRLT